MAETREEAVRLGKWKHKDSGQVLRVLATAEGWAMVRFPGCMTFAMPVKDVLRDYEALIPVAGKEEKA